MKRSLGAMIMLAGLGGFVSADPPKAAQVPQSGQFGRVNFAHEVPGLQGPYGEPVPVLVPAGGRSANYGGGVVPVAGWGNSCKECKDSCQPVKVLPPPQLPFNPNGIYPVPPQGPPGAVAAVGAIVGTPPQGIINARTEVQFSNPAGMEVTWLANAGAGAAFVTPAPITRTPGRYNFLQGGVYRLKLSKIPNLPRDLYPTLEVRPATHKTSTFLAHSAVPVSFTDEDFQQVEAGNFVVKVIYLPDPAFQDLAAAGIEEVVSTRLEPGADPIAEAQRRGTILLIVRLGNIDLGLQNSPAMDAPPNGVMPGFGAAPGMMPGIAGATLPPQKVPVVPPVMSAPVQGTLTSNPAPAASAPTLPGAMTMPGNADPLSPGKALMPPSLPK